LKIGISSGTLSFVKSTTTETVKISTRLVTATATALEYLNADPNSSSSTDKYSISKFSDQPRDVNEGLIIGLKHFKDGLKKAQKKLNDNDKGVIIQPVIGFVNGISKALIGIQNTLDQTHQKRSEDKYK
jgi:nanoRNase/pAp phosphatase (c-di-AMP/oligoRNAs hydrolase)